MKKALIIALVLIVVGAAVVLAVFAATGFDFAKLSVVKYEERNYTVTEGFTKIRVESDVTDIILKPSADGAVRVNCYEAERVKYTVSVSDGELVIKETDERKWYDHIELFSRDRDITVYLPVTEYESLVVNVDTGDVQVPSEFSFGTVGITTDTGDVDFFAYVLGNVRIETDTGDVEYDGTAGALEISTNTGDVDCDASTGGPIKITTDTGDVTCSATASSLEIETDTGDVALKNTESGSVKVFVDTGEVKLSRVKASGKMEITTSTGDVLFEMSDAQTISVATDTGDVTGTLLTDKIFRASSNTGRVRVPNTLSGGLCEIEVNTGDISIEIAK